MTRFAVAGLINLETTLKVDGFPIGYSPARYPFFGVDSTISGVGFNLARALTVLGDEVDLLSLVGNDLAGEDAESALRAAGIPSVGVLHSLEHTAQSAILYDPHGRRQINVDLKDIQEQTYPESLAEAALKGCDLAVLCNINFSRALLPLARKHTRKIATDVHALSSLDDAYNLDFLCAADILFMSDELLPEPAEDFARKVIERFATPILVIGQGERGALLAVRGDKKMVQVPAVRTRPLVSTIGAGDALMAAFLHEHQRHGDPYEALRTAVVFASYKIGEKGAAEGFLSADELHAWRERVYANPGSPMTRSNEYHE